MPFETRACVQCGEAFRRCIAPTTVKRGHGQFCSIACSTRHHRTGKQSNNWQGGRKCGNGYVLVHTPGNPHADRTHGYAKEHRLVVAQMLGRPLTRSEVVHHINGDRKDNRPENLAVMTQAEHLRTHRREQREKRGAR